MAKKKKKKGRVPKALWRLFGNRARTLADTILCLLPKPPPSPEECVCEKPVCIGCCGDKAPVFLLRAKDPPDYRKLLTRCFVVVADNAPPSFDFDPNRYWDHLEVIRRSIEMIMSKQTSSSNVICCGYDKGSRTSDIVELLSSSAWRLLWRRVGDVIMGFLLKNTSLFLPLPQSKYFQVAGYPISSLCQRYANYMSSSGHQHISQSHHGCGKKRKVLDEVDTRKANVKKTPPDGSTYADGANREVCNPENFQENFKAHKMPRKRKRQTSWQRRKKRRQLNCAAISSLIPFSETLNNVNSYGVPLYEDTSKAADVEPVRKHISPLNYWQENTHESFKSSKKCLRQYCWQRRRKRLKLKSKVTSSLSPCFRTLVEKQNESLELLSDLETSLTKLDDTALIGRNCIFYKLKRSPSVLPRKLKLGCCYIKIYVLNNGMWSMLDLDHAGHGYGFLRISCKGLSDILNTLKPNNYGANILFRQIFGSSDALRSAKSAHYLHHEHSLVKSRCLYHFFLERLKYLIRKFQRCQHLRLLDKHCPILSMDQFTSVGAGFDTEGCESHPVQVEEDDGNGLTGEAQSFQRKPSKFCCLKKQVISFIWAACRSIVPRDLLGSPRNWRILRKCISKFIHLRRFEKFTLRQCVYKLKVSNFPRLLNKYSLCLGNIISGCGKGQRSSKRKVNSNPDATDIAKHQILERWILWLFRQIVVPLLQANFYATENEYGSQEVYYYRRSIWEELACKAFNGLKGESQNKLTTESVREIVRGRPFGFSRIRLCPKGRSGFRVLANLKAPSRLPAKSSIKYKYEYFKSVNKALSDVHGVLKGVQMTEPEKLGSSVFDYNDVYRKYVPFLSLLKNGPTEMPSVFVVASDVSKAFDTIDQKKLLSVMDEIMSKDEYPLKKYLQVVCTNKSLLVRKHYTPPDHENIPGSLGDILLSCAPSSIIIKEEANKKIRKKDLYLNLDEHIRHNVLQFGNIFFSQRVGIPQGSVLSSLLCSFYLGHLERNVIFPFLENAHKADVRLHSVNSSPDNTSDLGVDCETESPMCAPNFLLLRLIDDFLFISTSRRQASLFFSRLNRGFAQYNCFMNEGKFGLNFKMDEISHIGSSRHIIGDDGILFLRWSGLLVNGSTLEIQADYCRYTRSHLSTSLTVSWDDCKGRLLKTKLYAYLRPKCHPLFYDSNINSAPIVRLNIYQAFLLAAMKFHCYVSELKGISAVSVECCTDAVLKSLRYMQKLIKRRMHCIRLDPGFRPNFEVAKEEIEWLGLTAFVRVLKRKHSCNHDLLSRLGSKLTRHKVGKNISSALEYAVDDLHSSLLWKIKY